MIGGICYRRCWCFYQQQKQGEARGDDMLGTRNIYSNAQQGLI